MEWYEIVKFCLFILPFWVMISLALWGGVAEQVMDILEDLRRRRKE